MIVYFQRNYRSFKIWGSIPMAYSLKAIADDLLSVERSYTFTMIVKFTFYQMFLVFKDWFQCFSVSNLLLMLPLYRFCFQSTFLFPMSDVSFQFLYIFSKLNLCFQIAMFPMYVSNIYGAVFQSGYGLGEVK